MSCDAERPFIGMVRIAEIAANPPDNAHTTLEVRFAEMPYSRAVSGLSAEDRIARPSRVRVSSKPRPVTMMGTRSNTMISRSRSSKPCVIFQAFAILNGSGNDPPLAIWGSDVMARRSSTPTPNVAINNTMRGDVNSLRTNAGQYGTPNRCTIRPTSAAEKAPISACAKLITPVDRYSSTMPDANAA
jgi:hypothetical protein